MLVYEAARDLGAVDSVVLDVGTKDGRFLTGFSGRVLAIDVDLQTAGGPVEFFEADGRRMPFPGDAFDVVVSNQVLEHVSPTDRERMVAEIARVLSPGGVLLVSVPNRYFPLGGSPHWLPPFTTFLPRGVALDLADRFLDRQSYLDFEEALFPVSPWKVRGVLEKHFHDVEYITIDLGDAYGEEVWPEWFNSIFPIVSAVTQFWPIEKLFEWTFGYAAYECHSPKE